MLKWIKDNENNYFIIHKTIRVKISKSRFDKSGPWYVWVSIKKLFLNSNKQFPNSQLERAKKWAEKTIKDKIEDLCIASKQLAEEFGVDTE